MMIFVLGLIILAFSLIKIITIFL